MKPWFDVPNSKHWVWLKYLQYECEWSNVRVWATDDVRWDKHNPVVFLSLWLFWHRSSFFIYLVLGWETWSFSPVYLKAPGVGFHQLDIKKGGSNREMVILKTSHMWISFQMAVHCPKCTAPARTRVRILSPTSKRALFQQVKEQLMVSLQIYLKDVGNFKGTH